jgi:hypothetical protein
MQLHIYCLGGKLGIVDTFSVLNISVSKHTSREHSSFHIGRTENTASNGSSNPACVSVVAIA